MIPIYLRYFKSSQKGHKRENWEYRSCLGCWGVEEWRLLFNRYGVSVSSDSEVMSLVKGMMTAQQCECSQYHWARRFKSTDGQIYICVFYHNKKRMWMF